jgi:hypothetical protein
LTCDFWAENAEKNATAMNWLLRPSATLMPSAER